MTELDKLEPHEAYGPVSIGHYYSDERYAQARRSLEAAMLQAQALAKKQRKRNVRPWHDHSKGHNPEPRLG
jgi:hypothetical protein